MGLSDRFRVYLANRGRRLTAEREAIMTAALSEGEAFDTEQVINSSMIWFGGRSVSRATAYRTLLDMVSAGVLQKVDKTRFRRAAS